jgi:hypothetical protein
MDQGQARLPDASDHLLVRSVVFDKRDQRINPQFNDERGLQPAFSAD